jgi:HD-like signal output (HDOD) protein
MKRILFVDDDVSMLDALRVRLRPMRDKWAATFVQNGGRALLELQEGRYDVIVTDIRMRGMHGLGLLRTVSERWPQTVRIALSGYKNYQPSHLMPIAHRFLNKPCEPLQLESVLEQCLNVQDLAPRSAVRALVGRVQRLPPIRRTYLKLQSDLADKGITARDAARVIANDTVLTAKILQIVNISFHHLKRCISDIEEAVSCLGLSTVRALVMSAEVFSQWPPRETGTVPDLERLQLHIGSVAKVGLALTVDTPFAADAALAARLHDIGYWVLAQECPRELRRAVEFARAHELPLHEAEREVLGASHAEIGAYLLGLWGLPSPVVEAIAEHHRPERAGRLEFDASAALVVAIALSDSDDADAFRGIPRSTPVVGPEYFEQLRAPFDWQEATRRAAMSLS